MSQPSFYVCGTPTGWRMSQPAPVRPEESPEASQAESPASPTPSVDSAPNERSLAAMGPVEDLDTRGVRRFLAESTGTNNTKACRIVIGVPASWCGCASVSAEGLPKGNAEQREQAMAFRLESELPITAEDCAIGLLQGQDPGTHLGVAVESSRLAELVHGLEDDGHEVEAIVPRGLLTAQAYLGRATPDDLKQSVGLVWHESDGADGQGQTQLLLVGPNQSPRWRVLDTTPEALAQQLALDDDATQATRVWKLETNCKSIYRPVIEQRGSNVSIESVTLAGQAEEQAALRILERRQRPWVDLRRGPLAPRHVWRRLRFPASACVAAAAILLVTAIALLWLRADEYNHLAQQHDEQGRRAFAEAMPGQAVPTSPQRRLKTRIKQLRGEQGLAAGDEQLTDQSPTLLLLHDLLAGLPTDQRFAITDLRLEDGDLRLTGQARTHGEADQLANTLRTRSPFIVEPPSTDSLTKDKGVRFTIQATYRPPNQQASQPDKPDALVRRDGEARP